MGTIGKMSTNSLQDRIGGLLKSSQWSDCKFQVENSIISAHRIILAAASPVFEVMLFGPMLERAEIQIRDIDSHTFEKMLNYIYTDAVNVIDIESACHLLYAATKYMLPNLQGVCRTYLNNELSISNALLIFDFADSIQDEKLLSVCLDIICRHTRNVFSENNFHLNASTLKEIVKQDNINISELELLDICVKWAVKECEFRKMNPSSANQRYVLIECELLNKIRFLTFSVNEFMTRVQKYDILSAEEINSIQEYITNHLKNPNIKTYFEFKPRNNIKLIWRHCARQYFKSAHPLWISESDNVTNVIFTCNRAVLVKSFSIPSRVPPADITKYFTTYNEKITFKVFDSERNVVAEAKFDEIVEYYSTMNLNLLNPVVLKANEKYDILFEWNFKDSPYATAHYPQQFVSDIGTKQSVMFYIQDQDASFLSGITYTM